MEEIDRIMLDFILKNKGTTENKLVHYMTNEGLLSRVPILKKIDEFESSGKIIVLRGKGRQKGKAHHLLINNQNAYNKIYEELSEIDNILDKIDRTNEIIPYLITSESKQDDIDYYNSFQLSHVPIQRMLQFMLILTNKLIQSEKDSQLLNMRIVDLFLKSEKRFGPSRNGLEQFSRDLELDIHMIKSHLQNPRIYEYTKFDYLSEAEKKDLDFSDNLIENIQKFKKVFLDDFSSI